VITATLAGLEPHRHGQIPIVFVHGTASNFSVWANMVNDLDSDPVIRQHFEYWLFTYDSGQPILYSASQLRQALTATVSAFQAEDPDPCLDKMVVIGHSQGGLLTKLTAIRSGDLFWRNLSPVSIEEANLSEQARALVKEVMFVEPLPFVRRVVFIATPQRGSYLAGASIVRRLAERLISLPASLVSAGADLLRTGVASQAGLEKLPTSIDNMSPGHPFIVTIAKIPVEPGIAANSIIGVTGNDPLETGGDGVVKYTSAHIEGVESELVVHYEHSMQSKPEVIGEVQRILHRHLELNSCTAAPTNASQGATRGPSAEIR
jgi:pimeloyl-ACP methyl ester carboxylesterase